MHKEVPIQKGARLVFSESFHWTQALPKNETLDKVESSIIYLYWRLNTETRAKLITCLSDLSLKKEARCTEVEYSQRLES